MVPNTPPAPSPSVAASSETAPDRFARDGTILEARDLTKGFRTGNRDVEVLRGISLKVRRASS